MSLQKRNTNIFDLHLKDIEVFIGLSSTLSIRELSRKSSYTPSQISKKITKMESVLDMKLFNRSTKGLSLSTAGEKVLPKLKAAQKILLNIEDTKSISTQKRIVIASSSFFVSHLLPKLIKKHSAFYFDLMELPPEDFIQVGLRSGFNTCLHTQKLDWPATWHSEKVGEIHSKLYARKDHPIFKMKKINLESYPFVAPAYWTREGLKEGKDSFPKSLKRNFGHRTSTALSAAEVLKWSDHLGFLPSTVALGIKGLKEVNIPQTKVVKQSVYLTAKSDEIPHKFFKSLALQISKTLI